jgi:hypothetical protein
LATIFDTQRRRQWFPTANWGRAGYIDARTNDITPGGSFVNGTLLTTPEGSFSGSSQVPFAGIYTAFTKQNFFADAQIRWDFYQNNLSDRNNGLFNQRLDARGISVTGNVGYNIPLPITGLSAIRRCRPVACRPTRSACPTDNRRWVCLRARHRVDR